MEPYFLTEGQYANLVNDMGAEAAARFIKKEGMRIEPDEAQFRAVPPSGIGGEDNMEDDDPDFAVADEDAADDTADVSSSLSAKPKSDELSQWESSQAAFLRKAQAQRQKQFEDAKAYIEQNYRGPTSAEKFYALAAALSRPRDFGGWKGAIANITPAFADIAAAERTAGQKRAEALLNLQNKYQSGEIEAEGDALKNQLAVIRARAAANKPQWARTQDPVTGEVTLTPVYPGQQPPSGMKPPPSPDNTRTIKSQTDLIKLPPHVLYFIAESDPTKTPREIPGR